MSRAAIQLLTRRWSLPPAAVPVLERFIDNWARGHTSLDLSEAEAASLAGCAAVGDGCQPAPLVLRNRRLQSWRVDQAETRVAVRMRALAGAAVETGGPSPVELINQLLDDPTQRRAALLGLDHSLALITGGPGTGKTTTAARLLAVLASRDPGTRVALAAPTGKAAARLGEMIRQAAQELPAALADVRPRLEQTASQACTLQKLLRWQPQTDRCGLHAGNPLPVDVVVVDEASMLDLFIWDRLLDAIGTGTRLVVLGDHRQLQSVQPGHVLAELIQAAHDGALAGRHVELERNYRHARHPLVSDLARAVRQHDGADAVRVLNSATEAPDLGWFSSTRIDEALDQIWPLILDVVRAPDAGAALAALGKVQILCALRRGPYGVTGLNARVEARLRSEGLPASDWTYGRPILVTTNDPHSGLFNGDVGVLCAAEDGGEITATFDRAGEPRRVPLAALPAHQTAWAMTVHRAQGSEFDSVLLVLPPEPHELCGPELLYTGVTRAKERMLVAAEEPAIRAACEPRATHRAGLLEKVCG